MDDNGRKPQKEISGMELHTYPTEYHTWGLTVFVLENPFKGGLVGLTKW